MFEDIINKIKFFVEFVLSSGLNNFSFKSNEYKVEIKRVSEKEIQMNIVKEKEDS